jgi:hypothetical protein
MGVTPKIMQGKDYNFFQRVTINSNTFAQISDITIPFRNSNMGFSMIFEGSGIIEYSFNGNTVHGDMDSTALTKGLVFDNRKISAVWFRLKTAGAGVTLRFEAWAV